MTIRTDQGQVVRLASAPTIESTLDEFAAYMAGRKFSPKTISTYSRAVRAFGEWLGGDATIADIRPERLIAYQADLRKRSAATIGKYLSAIRCYSRYLSRAGLRADDPTIDLTWPKRHDPPPRDLSSAELAHVNALLDRPLPTIDKKARWVRARDKRAICLMLYAGLRLSEVADLSWADVDIERRSLIVRRGKGGKWRTVSIHDYLIDHLSRVPVAERVGFVAGGRQGRKLSGKTLAKMFERGGWVRESGLELSAHDLRHAFALACLRAGVDIRRIQDMLGHASLATTQIYLHLDLKDKQEAIGRLPSRIL